MKRKHIIIVIMVCSLFFAGCQPKSTIYNSENGNVSDKNSTEEFAELQSTEDATKESMESSVAEPQTDNDEETASAELEATGIYNSESKTDTPSTIRIIMVGDVLLHDRVQDSGKSENGYSYDHLFQNVKDYVSEADLALVNQEVILGGSELGLSGYPAFNGAFEVGDALVNAGFDVVLHGTNHALDKGKKGLLNCLNFWDNTYPQIDAEGIHDSAEDDNEICIRQVGDYSVAVLNYTYGTNGIEPSQDIPYAVEYWNDDRIAEDVALAKQSADFVIVCPHWGTEYVLTATDSQKRQAQFLADLGVDVVIGTHPHVIEPVSLLQGRDGNETLVYYSLGNYINATSGTGPGTSDRMLGAMAEIVLGLENGRPSIVEYGALPLVSHVESGYQKCTTYFLEDYTEELAAKNEIRKQDGDFSKAYCENLWTEVMGE